MPDRSHIIGPNLTKQHEELAMQIGKDFLDYIEQCHREGYSESRQILFESWVMQELAGIRMVVKELLERLPKT